MDDKRLVSTGPTLEGGSDAATYSPPAIEDLGHVAELTEGAVNS